jgi:hypothetical protein
MEDLTTDWQLDMALFILLVTDADLFYCCWLISHTNMLFVKKNTS